MNKNIIMELKGLVGEDYLLFGEDKVDSYLYDETDKLLLSKASDGCVVVKPKDSMEISQIMKLANKEMIPVIVRGGATGIAGGVVPYQESIIISMERLNKVIEVDTENQMIVVESAVTLADLNEALAKESLMFPVHPGDEGAQVGGMVVTNAGGVRAVKHGIMRNHIKGVEVVLPNGEIVSWGGKIIKNNAGLDLMHLMIGSEGALGVVTNVTLKLYPRGGYSATLVTSFDDYVAPSETALKILESGIIPLAIEYVPSASMVKSAEMLGYVWPFEEGSQNLIIILDEESEDLLYEKCEKIVGICEEYGADKSIMADTNKEQREILEIRSALYELFAEARKHKTDNLERFGFDTAVPISKIKEYIEKLSVIGDKYGTQITGVGHLGDGNLHLGAMHPYENGQFPDFIEEFEKEVLELTLELGGTVSAEHGIGKVHTGILPIQFSDTELQIMRNIKKAFDPNGIMNPGTLIK